MASTFVAYIDESGDQGFKFNDDPAHPGSKRWFVLSAIIVRQSNNAGLIRDVAELRKKLRLQAKQPIHFSELSHSQKVLAIHEIAEMPVKIINVLVEKERLRNPDVFKGAGFRLYFYTMRLLLERISWICRDASNAGPCKLVFERCKGLNYEALQEYIGVLRAKGRDPFSEEVVNIEWDFLDLAKLRIENKDLIGALQLADCFASAAQWAVEKRYGHIEHRFIKTLKPRVYFRKKYLRANYLSYGMKFLVTGPEFHWVRKYYS